MARKVVFLGSKRIGWLCLEELWQRRDELDIDLVQIGTNPNRKDEYHEKIVAFAKNNSIALIQNDAQIQDNDFLLSVQYHNILTADILQRSHFLAANLHMAPLPEYRGCNQFSFAILDQKTEFGTSLHIMDPQIDHGDLLAQRRFSIAQDIWVEELYRRTESESVLLWKENLGPMLSMELKAIPQSTLEGEYGSKLHYRSEMNSIKKLDLLWPEEKIMRHIRASYMPGFPGPYFMIDGQKVEVKIP